MEEQRLTIDEWVDRFVYEEDKVWARRVIKAFLADHPELVGISCITIIEQVRLEVVYG